MIIRWLARKLILDGLDHDIRNATLNIEGILRRVKKSKRITSRNINDIHRQLNRIECALNYVLQSNKGK